jgi:integral membrane sensor domain MASE1
MRPRAISHDWLGGKSRPHYRWLIRYVVELLGIGLAYFGCAKAGLLLASVNPSTTPIWPATGLALAAVLLLGYRISPAILLAAFLANAATGGSIATSALNLGRQHA